MLVSRGHRLTDVLENYTMIQVQEFFRAAEVDRSDQFIMRATAARAAQQSDRDWKKFLREYRAMTEERAGTAKPRKVISKTDAERLRMLLGGKKDG